MKKINIIVACLGFLGLFTMSIIAIVDSYAEDMMSAVVVQILFGAMFISGYISLNKK